LSTDPFVIADLTDAPRQAQNLAPGVSLPAARTGVGVRPGAVEGPWPTGPGFGSPGPNIGFAFTLVQRARDRFALAVREHTADAYALVAALAMKRASSFGRAPVVDDVSCGLVVLGYEGPTAESFVEWRLLIGADAAHDYIRVQAVCDAVAIDDLRQSPARLVEQIETIHERLRTNLVTTLS